jgi:iron(II)-dependent oxidoreductase
MHENRTVGAGTGHRSILAAGLLIYIGAVSSSTGNPGFDLVDIPSGQARLGDATGDANEIQRLVQVAAFRIMRNEVTNTQFDAFVMTTGYRTDAESGNRAFVWTDRWRISAGADRRHPHGTESSIDGKAAHPAVQVSARDADAFCAHYGMRLPSEDEWEYAARGTDGRRFPWGNEPPRTEGKMYANFGTIACCAADGSDGHLRTAPVASYPDGASPFGLQDMAGNVWEWTSSRFPGRPFERVLRGGGWGNDPYCLRAAYRHGNPPEISLDMVGFRCAGDME